MIVDTSAIVAILRQEPDSAAFAHALAAAPATMSAATYLECGIVHDAWSEPAGHIELDNLIREADMSIAPVTAAHARIARQAYRDFGRGSGHPARLNFGDCFSYALAIDSGEPLLWKGEDFSHTGVRSALAES